ncbi:attractin-like protein 1-like, partial [Scleropages formosus]
MRSFEHEWSSASPSMWTGAQFAPSSSCVDEEPTWIGFGSPQPAAVHCGTRQKGKSSVLRARCRTLSNWLGFRFGSGDAAPVCSGETSESNPLRFGTRLRVCVAAVDALGHAAFDLSDPLLGRLTEPSGSLTDGPINYKYKTKCTWLIEGYPNAVLRLRFNHFATECTWDHMYVYDGDSVYAPLIAVFSGLVVPEVRGNETVPEVVTTSGYALLHFFSDAAYNLTGFNIFYSINSCPNNCSGHGKCSTGNSIASRVYCECDDYWKGEACDIPYCRSNCGSPDHGYCDLTGEKLCVCNDSWQGGSRGLCPLPSRLTEVQGAPLYRSTTADVSAALTCEEHSKLEHTFVAEAPLSFSVAPEVLTVSNKYLKLQQRLLLAMYCSSPFPNRWLWRHLLPTCPDCSLTVPSTESYWALPNVKPFSPSVGRASHKAVVQGKLMWVIGGYTFNYSSFPMVLNYNLESSIWNVVPVHSGPLQRYGHSLALYQDDIYMFGGKIETRGGNVTDELWVFNIPSRMWSLRAPNVLVHGQQYAVEGHSAHVVELDNGEVVMVVIFGYSSIYSYISNVQEYNLRTNTWVVPETQGAIVQGGYGHSSVYDGVSRCVYVHGGYKALPANKYGLVDDLYRFEVRSRTCCDLWVTEPRSARGFWRSTSSVAMERRPSAAGPVGWSGGWRNCHLSIRANRYSSRMTILKESGFARYLHSAVLLSGSMLVFGGNTHNDTSLSNGAKCFSADFLAYDI